MAIVSPANLYMRSMSNLNSLEDPNIKETFLNGGHLTFLLKDHSKEPLLMLYLLMEARAITNTLEDSKDPKQNLLGTTTLLQLRSLQYLFRLYRQVSSFILD